MKVSEVQRIAYCRLADVIRAEKHAEATGETTRQVTDGACSKPFDCNRAQVHALLAPLAEAAQELSYRRYRLLSEARLLRVIVRCRQEQCVGARPVLARIPKPLLENPQRLHHLGMLCDRAGCGFASRGSRTVFVVQERENQIVRILVLVPTLEREDLKDHVRENVCHPYGDPGLPSAVETLAFDVTLDEVVAHEMCAADVERAKAGPGELALRPEDATGLHLVGLAEELHEDADSLDVAGPPEAWLSLLEVRLLQVVLQSPIRLGRLVAEG